MRVKILAAVEYDPTSEDGRSCWGSLLKRPSKVPAGTRTVKAADGTDSEVSIFKVGPMVHYFPKDRTPELREEIAASFIARGVAELYDGPPTIESAVINGVFVQ